MTSYEVMTEAWPIAGIGFVISRETKKDALVVTVTLERNGFKGTGECLPLKRYGHSQESIKREIEDWLRQNHPWDRRTLIATLRAGPARFALDTAMWQLEAAEQGVSFSEYVGLTVKELPIAYTLNGVEPDAMADAALKHSEFRWLKLKLMGDGKDAERLYAIHSVLAEKELMVDANEALTVEALNELLPVFEFCNVVLIEQPLPAGKDDALKDFQSSIPLAADESCHAIESLDDLVGKYDVVNIKLDKAGGLTHALDMKKRAEDMGFNIMVGCMVETGLAILPAFILAQDAAFADLDGALLLEKDRPDSKISYRDGKIFVLN